MTRVSRNVQPPMKDVFLCHTGSDKPWVEYLAERLEAETVDGTPSGRRIEVFLDKWDIDYGENILRRIEEGLRNSRFCAVVLSPAFTRADWPAMEWHSQVYADPSGRQARILPILRHRYDPETGQGLDIPLPLWPLKYFDFADDARFEAEFDRFLRRIRGERPARGGKNSSTLGEAPMTTGRAAPDDIEESLFSNLLPVVKYPLAIWSDYTTAESKPDVWNAYKGKSVAPFALHDKRLYSFARPDAEGSPFRAFLTGADPRSERSLDWLADPDKSRILIGLFNAAMREHCRQLDIWATKEIRPRFYCPFVSRSRAFRWSTRARQRTLAKLIPRANGEKFGVHYSSRMRFITLGTEIYLVIEPGWLFTADGVKPLTGKEVTRFSTLWGGKERNAAVLRNVLMWSVLLARGEPEIRIELGDGEVLTLESVPAYADSHVGISGDTMRLERLLGGDGGGEVLLAETDELDTLAALELAGTLDAGEENVPAEDIAAALQVSSDRGVHRTGSDRSRSSRDEQDDLEFDLF